MADLYDIALTRRWREGEWQWEFRPMADREFKPIQTVPLCKEGSYYVAIEWHREKMQEAHDLLRDCLTAITTAVLDEDGLDGSEAELLVDRINALLQRE